MVAWVGFGEFVEATAAPVEVATVDDDAADAGAVAAEEFRKAMDDDVCSVLERSAAGWAGDGAIDDEW